MGNPTARVGLVSSAAQPQLAVPQPVFLERQTAAAAMVLSAPTRRALGTRMEFMQPPRVIRVPRSPALRPQVPAQRLVSPERPSAARTHPLASADTPGRVAGLPSAWQARPIALRTQPLVSVALLWQAPALRVAWPARPIALRTQPLASPVRHWQPAAKRGAFTERPKAARTPRLASMAKPRQVLGLRLAYTEGQAATTEALASTAKRDTLPALQTASQVSHLPPESMGFGARPDPPTRPTRLTAFMGPPPTAMLCTVCAPQAI